MSFRPFQMVRILATQETIVAGIAGRQLKTTERCEADGEPAWKFMGKPIVTTGRAPLNAIKERFLEPVPERKS